MTGNRGQAVYVGMGWPHHSGNSQTPSLEGEPFYLVLTL